MQSYQSQRAIKTLPLAVICVWAVTGCTPMRPIGNPVLSNTDYLTESSPPSVSSGQLAPAPVANGSQPLGTGARQIAPVSPSDRGSASSTQNVIPAAGRTPASGHTTSIRGQSPDPYATQAAWQSQPGSYGGATAIPSTYAQGGVRPAQYTAPANMLPPPPDAQVAQLQNAPVQPASPGPYGVQTQSQGSGTGSYYDPGRTVVGETPSVPQPSPYAAPQQSAPVTNYQTITPQPPIGAVAPNAAGAPLAPIVPFGQSLDSLETTGAPRPLLQPRIRTVPVDVFVTPARTGRFMIGGAVNSDAGVTGQIVLDERNFDLLRFPRSFQELFSGYAFRGGGQTFRLEAVPGSDFQRYTMSFGQPYLFNYLPFSLSVQGFLFDRNYLNWQESRLGGRVQLGYRITNQLSFSGAVRAENVDFSNVTTDTAGFLESFVGEHDLFSGSVRLTHDTRDIPFAPTEGHLIEMSFEQTFGDFDYSRWQLDARKYFLIRERADRSGRHTLAFTNKLGISGEETPVFENFFAGGFSTIRGFDFRGASPKINTSQVGGRFSFLGSLEYQFPLTADDSTKGVVFCDYGTVERDIEIDKDNFRVAPGFGFRVSMPALGPAPLAFDFAFPVAYADTDERQVFSFFMGFSR